MKRITYFFIILFVGINCTTSFAQLTHEQIFDAYVSQNKSQLVSQMQKFEYSMPLPSSGVSITTMARYPVLLNFPKEFCSIYRIEVRLKFGIDVLSINEGWKIENLAQKMNTSGTEEKESIMLANTTISCFFNDGRFESTITCPQWQL